MLFTALVQYQDYRGFIRKAAGYDHPQLNANKLIFFVRALLLELLEEPL